MRWRSLIWLVPALLLLAVLAWWSGASHARRVAPELRAAGGFSPAPLAGLGLRNQPDKPSRAFAWRLSNSTKTVNQLVRNEKAILLENALIDTERPVELSIPESLRARDGHDSYIVQGRPPLTGTFQTLLTEAGAKVIAYIPNNAYLVRASAQIAGNLETNPQVHAILRYEPYYKLQPPLLAIALDPSLAANGYAEADTSIGSKLLSLNLLLFPDSVASTVPAVRMLAAEVVVQGDSPFGPVLAIQTASENLARLASLSGVQRIEFSRRRATATDLIRATIGVALNSTTQSNYLGLTGTNIVVDVNDTGVDSNYPGLANRVLSDLPASASDTNGHGTHIAGIIGGNGALSRTVVSAPGSLLPAVDFQFRGVAPGSSIYSVSLTALTNGSDAYLQQTAARAGALISNNSWYYAGQSGYDLAAASYDGAARDALPTVSGSQPVLFVFAAGNTGGGADDGTGGTPGTIQSPGTAKNVLTVGALDQQRWITNETWTCSTNGGTCQTNFPWLWMTDSSNLVAAFSARGNVDPGMESEFGRFKPDIVAPGTFVVSARPTQWDEAAYYADTNNAVVPAPDANYFAVLSNLNNGVGPFYRFESGTSQAAAAASGTLALLQEFFEQRVGRTNSPALMKALLINGARPLTNLYGFAAHGLTNAQGWGLIHLPNSIPAALTNLTAPSQPMFLFDQSPAGALATGQAQTRFVSVSWAARNQPLRVTLVWTDPPANPVAATKLVNDLDLIVTNLDTGEVFLGNDIPAGGSFNAPSSASDEANRDCINNVENVYLAPGLGANYSITVVGRRVSVNAVSEQAGSIAQDYALVISSGDGQVSNALTLTPAPIRSTAAPWLTVITNAFAAGTGFFGNILTHQQVGANSPLLATNAIAIPGFPGAFLSIGQSQQWQFYAFSNSTSFSNVAFLTFFGTPRALPSSQPGFAAESPDIDLYVSTDPGLTNLDPVVLANADSSIGRGADEMIVYTNAPPGLFYIGVKSETQEAADYGFVAIASASPFAQADAVGNELLHGFSLPAAIPAAQGAEPGENWVFAVCPDSIPVHRVIVTNTLTCATLAALQSSLVHDGTAVGLMNHSGTGMVDHATFIYDDTSQADVAGAQHSDGPGSLVSFGGQNGFGQWRLDLLSTNSAGTENDFWIFLEQQPDLSGSISATILPGTCRDDYVNLPATTTNLTVMANYFSGTGPLVMQACRLGDPINNYLPLPMSSQSTNGTIILDDTSHPPLDPGTYFLHLCNGGPDVVMANMTALSTSDLTTPALDTFTSPSLLPILDEATSVSTIDVTNQDSMLSVEVGVRISHPRVSDLALRLISPAGTEVLLDENRGGMSAGMGSSMIITNTIPVSYSGGPEAVTNVVDTGQTSGVISINYDMYALPDDMRVYYEGRLLYDSGLVSFSGSTNLAYGPGLSTSFTIVMNEGGNANSNTSWFYSVSSTQLIPVYFTFTEDTNVASVPIKFAPTPFSSLNYFGSGTRPSSGIFYLPEESLGKFTGESAHGLWRLEIDDSRAGATNPPPQLLGWQLAFRFRDTIPTPINLVSGQPVTNMLGSGEIQWFAVAAPTWVSFATNTLVSASAPVRLLFNQFTPPIGTNAGDSTLLANATSGTVVLSTNSMPAFNPGTRFYLGVQNTNNQTVGFVLQIGYDINSIVTLQSGVPYADNNPGAPEIADYYRYVVTPNAVRVQFEINGPTANVTLLARQGPPPPTLNSYDYISANPGTNDELIVVYDYSSPVPLAAGEWFLTVANVSAGPGAYTIMATEFSSYGTNIVLTTSNPSSNTLCFSWNSLPGIHYFLQGKESLDDTNWVTLSPTLTASDVFTAYCLPLPTPFDFFRVQEGIVVTPPPLIITSISSGPTGVLLQWLAATNLEFQVEWTASIGAPQWGPFTNKLSSSSGVFSFLDDGSQTGGLANTRYYRLHQLH